MGSLSWIVASLLLLLGVAPVAAGTPDELEALREADLRVATIGYRLAVANRDLCARQAPQRGFVIHAAAQYAGMLRKDAVAYFRLGATPSVMAVVPGGPAARAGLMPDDRLIAVGSRPVPEASADRATRFDETAEADAMIEVALANGGARLEVERVGRRLEISLPAMAGCASRFQLTLSPQVSAGADGSYVTVRSALVNFVANDDELAVVIGHELAHNILGHRGMLAAENVSNGLSAKFGAGARKIRATEIEADRYGLYLAARAGYDVGVAPSFWQRFEREHGHGIFADATHPGARERQRLIAATLAEIERKRAGGEPLTP